MFSAYAADRRRCVKVGLKLAHRLRRWLKISPILGQRLVFFLVTCIYLYLLQCHTCIIQCPAENDLQVTLNTNISAGVGDSVARQARDVRSTPAQCWPNVYEVNPPPNQPRPNTPA